MGLIKTQIFVVVGIGVAYKKRNLIVSVTLGGLCRDG